MKKILAILLAAIILLSMFAGCNDDKAPSADTPDTTEPGDGTTPDDSTPKPDAEPAGPTVDPTYVNMLVWGDSTISCNTMDILVAFAKADGIIITTYANSYDNRNERTSYILYELFNYAGTDADAEIISDSSAAKIVKTNLDDTSKTMDYFLLNVSREHGVGLESANGRILTALKNLDARYQTNNENGKFLFLSGPGFAEGYAEENADKMESWGLNAVGATTTAAHNELIKKHAQEMADAAKSDSEIMQLGDAFIAYYEKYYATTGIDLYAEDKRLFSPAGSYFTAAFLYATIFGNSPAKIPVSAFIPEEEAKVLREAAHEIVFGTSAASVERDYDFVNINYDTSIKPEYADEVYPEYYDELMAAAYAYENRLTMIQYDQQELNRKASGSDFFRRSTVDSYPENNSPQKFLYLDCSAFIYSLFDNVFGYTFQGAVRTVPLLKVEDGSVFLFKGDATPASNLTDITEYADGVTQPGYINGKPVTDDEARHIFMDTLQPGDVIVYGGPETGGHVILYIGNGQVIHCAARSMGGAGADYNFTTGVDNLEMSPGGILRDDIEIFTYYWGNDYRYLFASDNNVRILRPLSLGLTPTEEAVARKENLTDIVAYKETTAFDGVTVSAGKDVTITYTVENIGRYNRTVQIVDTLPAALKYKSGDGKHSSGTVTIDVDIPAYSTKAFTYVLTVDASTADGTLISWDTKMCGVRMNLTPIRVGNTLSADEQAGVKAKVEEALKKSSTDIELALNLYKDGFNYTLPFSTAEEAFNKIFTINGSVFNIDMTNPLLARPLFGGQYLDASPYTAYERTQYVFSFNLVAGDILMTNGTGKADETEFWIYTGDDTFVTVKDGKTYTLSGSAARPLRESLMGEFCFCVLRPSLNYFKTEEAHDTPVEPGNTNAPLVKGNVLVLGDLPLFENDLAGTLTATLGSEYSIYNESYNTTPKYATSRMEPYEFFSFAVETCTGWSTGARGKRIAAYLEECTPEYIIFETGRRDTLNHSNTARTKTQAALEWLSETYPETKILLVASVPYPDSAFGQTAANGAAIGLTHTGTNTKEHVAFINAFAEECVAGIKNVTVVKVSDAFLSAATQNLSVYGTEGAYITQPNQNGSYLIACMLQTAITGKPATGLAFSDGIDGAKLQTVADSIK